MMRDCFQAVTQKELIEEAKARARMSTFEHSELLPEHEILQYEVPGQRKRRMRVPIQRNCRLNMARSYTRSTIGSFLASC
jgi:hypothetical protein